MGKIINDELESFLSDDNLHDFLTIIKKVPPATDEINRELIAQINEGNMEKREEMIKRNLRLVVSIVFKKAPDLKTDQKIDLIQDGIIGLMRAIETYDPTKSSFSTYATFFIEREVDISIKENNIIRRPQSFIRLQSRYYALLKSYESAGKQYPNDDEICKILNIKKSTLFSLKTDYTLNSQSLEQPINDEDSKLTIGDTISFEETSYSDILNSMLSEELLGILKLILTPIELYVIHSRILSDERKKLRELAEEFSLKSAQKIEIKALKKLRLLFDSDRELTISFEKISNGKDIKKLRTTPISPKDIVTYLFVRNTLSQNEQEDLKLMLFSDNKDDCEINPELLEKVRAILKEKENLFDEFYLNIIKEYRTHIYDIDLEIDITPYKKGIKYTYFYWKDKTYEDFLEMAESSSLSINDRLLAKIKTFFNVRENSAIRKGQCEKRLNTSLLRLEKSDEIPKKRLYETFCQNLNEFSLEQQTYLLWFFGKITKREALEKFPNLNINHQRSSLELKLQMCYFGIKSYRTYGLDRARYINVREKVKDTISPYNLDLLDFFFGINDNRQKSIEEVSEYLNISLSKTREKVRTAKLQVCGCIFGINHTLSLNFQIYKNYLETHGLKFSEPTDSILRMFLLEGKTYKEIEEVTNIDTTKISNYITDALWIIDCYRFDIFREYIPTNVDELLSILNNSSFDNKIKEILKYFLEVRDANITSEKFGLTVKTIRRYFRELNDLYIDSKTSLIIVKRRDIEMACNCLPTEMILTPEEIKVLSFKFGIKTVFNEKGITSTKIEDMTRKKYNSLVKSAIRKIKAKKLNLMRGSLDFISQKEVQRFLKDPHLPLEESDKKLISLIYGIDGRQVSLEEASEVLNISKRGASRKLQRAVVKIRRYENKEIEGFIDFNEDIYPYLKYFPKCDQKIFILAYYENKTAKEIAEVQNLTHEQAINLIYKLRIQLENMKDRKRKGIDFDYFWSNVRKNDIPFYGDRELAIQICYLFYEKRMAIADIVKIYPQLTENNIRLGILILPIAVMKHKEGILRSTDITLEEVETYYNANKDNMSQEHNSSYINYFESTRNSISLTKNPLNIDIIADILKNRENYISLSEVDKEFIKNVLTKHRENLSPSVIKKLIYLFNLEPRSYMSGSDINQVLSCLSNIDSTSQNSFSLKPQKRQQ